MKVALSHDWLNGMRGGEKCLESLIRLYPESQIHTLIHEKGKLSSLIENQPIFTSFLQRIPGALKHYKMLLPLFPRAIESMRAHDADLLISTSHSVAKGLPHPNHVRHICYCFTPMRYAWLFFDEYFGHYPSWAQKMIQWVLKSLRKWDLKASSGVTEFIAISHHIKKRIQDFYHRDAAVIYPPVDTDFYTYDKKERQDFYLVVSALVPYKRVDLAIEAAAQKNFKLKIVGKGPEEKRLKEKASSSVEFLGWLSNEEIKELYNTCKALIFPGEEDFGIVPVEAQSCGAPIIALGHGGALETIQENETGLFFKEPSAQSLNQAIEQFENMSWDASKIHAWAQKFSEPRFREEFKAFVEKKSYEGQI